MAIFGCNLYALIPNLIDSMLLVPTGGCISASVGYNVQNEPLILNPKSDACSARRTKIISKEIMKKKTIIMTLLPC